MARGYLEQRSLVMEGAKANAYANPHHLAEHHVALVYRVTPRASTGLAVPLLPPLRDNFAHHHFKLLNAVEVVERQMLSSGGRVLGFKLESQLIQDCFKGKLFNARTQQVVPKFADARLTLRSADGAVEEVNLEYVSPKYTDEMIREKAEAWRGSRTVWAAPSPAIAARVQAITGEPVLIV